MNLNPEKKMVLEWKGDYKLEARTEKGISVKYYATIEFGGEETELITNGKCFGKFSSL